MEDIEAIGLLQEPLRRRLYEFVVQQGGSVSRNEAAAAIGVQRTLVAFHLDKLADAGLLDVEHRRVGGKTGPGAGRPAKLYRRASAERQVAVPPRDYRTAAELLAEVADQARLDDELRSAARRRGATLADPPPTTLAEACALLAAHGYEPVLAGAARSASGSGGGAELHLRNCPFHVLAESHPGLVCGMNLALLEGLVHRAPSLTARIEAQPGRCCVVISDDRLQDL